MQRLRVYKAPFCPSSGPSSSKRFPKTDKPQISRSGTPDHSCPRSKAYQLVFLGACETRKGSSDLEIWRVCGREGVCGTDLLTALCVAPMMDVEDARTPPGQP
jgi:hypothetical protein